MIFLHAFVQLLVLAKLADLSLVFFELLVLLVELRLKRLDPSSQVVQLGVDFDFISSFAQGLDLFEMGFVVFVYLTLCYAELLTKLFNRLALLAFVSLGTDCAFLALFKLLFNFIQLFFELVLAHHYLLKCKIRCFELLRFFLEFVS